MNAPVTTLKTAAESDLSRFFANARPAGAESLRSAAFARVEASGLPHRRIEAWHYTDLRAMMRTAAPLAVKPAGGPEPWTLIDGCTVFSFVDGFLADVPELPTGVTMVSLAQEPARFAESLDRGVDLSGDIVTSLNTAFMAGGVTIAVAAGVAIDKPILLAFATTGPTASYARVAVTLGEGASMTLLETHRGAPDAQSNTVVETVLAPRAGLRHVRVNASDPSAQTLSTLSASVAAEARFDTLSFTMGAALSRHQVFSRVHGDDATIGVAGVTLLRGRQHADTTLVTEHDALRGVGRKLFKTIVDDEARGVFQGKIIVKPHAQKTDGKMASNTLLLGAEAQMQAKPELEIFADDVVCGHGATVGALDDELMFYLMSRGIGRREAEGLMIQAFAGEAIETVENEAIRDALNALTARWLAGRGS